RDLMPLERLAGPVRLLVPPGLLTGEVDHNEIGAAVAIHVVGEVAERVAVVVGIEFGRLVENRNHLPVRRGIVNAAIANVHFAVVVEVAGTGAFATELVVELHSLEFDLRRLGRGAQYSYRKE